MIIEGSTTLNPSTAPSLPPLPDVELELPAAALIAALVHQSSSVPSSSA